MKRKLLFLLLVGTSIVNAQFISTPPNRNGTIASGEYGDHTDGRNMWNDGSRNWYMTWDNTNLYLAVDANGNAANDEFVIYIDTDPQTPANGGSNSNGTLGGINFDGNNYARLPFRANFTAFIRNGYHQHRTDNGSGDWNSNVDNSTSIQKTTSGNTQEIAIAWSLMGGRPSSFNFFIYLNGGDPYGGLSRYSTSADNHLSSNTNLTARLYFNVASTADGSSTPPFSRLCYINQRASNDISHYGNNFFGVTVADNQTTTLNTNLTIASFLRIESSCIWTVSGDRTVTFTGSSCELVLNNSSGGSMNANPSAGNTANYNVGNGSDECVLTLDGSATNNFDVFSLNIKDKGELRLNNKTLRTGNAGTITVESGGKLLANSGSNNTIGEWGGTSNFTIQNNGNVVVQSTRGLSINTDNFTNNGTITLEAGSSKDEYARLISSAASGTGDTIIQKLYVSPGSSYKWYALGPSTSGVAANSIGAGQFTSTSVYSWSATGGWSSAHTATLDRGKGYFYAVGENNPHGYFTISSTDNVLAFSGSTPNNNADLTISLDYGTAPSGVTFSASPGVTQGWNLLANPYHADYDLNGSHGDNTSTEKSLHIRTSSGYQSYNPETNTPSSARYLSPAEGFFVRADNTGREFTFSRSRRVTSGGDGLLKPQLNFDRINMEVKYGDKSDRTYILFKQDATVNFDGLYDAHKFNNAAGYPMIYTVLSNVYYSINTLPELTGYFALPMRFTCSEAGQYTISIFDQQDFNPSISVLLEDKLMNNFALLNNADYTFAHNPANSPDRFVLHFNKSQVGTAEVAADKFNAWVYNGIARIKGLEHLGSATVKITDLSGRMIASYHTEIAAGATAEFILPSLAQGVYLLTIESATQTKAVKFIHY